MKEILAVILVVVMVVFSSKKINAAEDHSLENVFKDSYYGAAIGGLLGAALMVFTDRPADHFNYIAYGLAGGVIAGTVYGLTYQARSLTDIDDGKLVVAIPQPEIRTSPQMDPTERRKTILYVPVVRYHF